MRHIRFDKQALVAMDPEFWEKWERAAENATRQAIAEAEAGTPGLNQKVWKDLDWLLQHVFDGKCAYCENTITGVRATATRSIGGPTKPLDASRRRGGDASHRREQSRLLLARLPLREPPASVREVQHTGQGHAVPYPGRVHARTRGATDIKELDRRERPLILHPYSDDALPEEHIEPDVLGNAVPANGSRSVTLDQGVQALRRIS